MLTFSVTQRGFGIWEGSDSRHMPFSIQESSITTESCLWIGNRLDEKSDRLHASRGNVSRIIDILLTCPQHQTLIRDRNDKVWAFLCNVGQPGTVTFRGIRSSRELEEHFSVLYGANLDQVLAILQYFIIKGDLPTSEQLEDATKMKQMRPPIVPKYPKFMEHSVPVCDNCGSYRVTRYMAEEFDVVTGRWVPVENAPGQISCADCSDTPASASLMKVKDLPLEQQAELISKYRDS